MLRAFFLGENYLKEIVTILHYLDPDDATDLVQRLKNNRRKLIIRKLDASLKDKVEYLLKFDPRTAAGLMSLDYVIVKKGIKFQEVYKTLKKHELRTGRTPAILVAESVNRS